MYLDSALHFLSTLPLRWGLCLRHSFRSTLGAQSEFLSRFKRLGHRFDGRIKTFILI